MGLLSESAAARCATFAGILGDQQAALVGQTCFKPGRSEKYLWHRLLSSDECRRETGALQIRAPDHCRPTRLGISPLCMPWRAASRSPALWSSGCVTISASSPRVAEIEDLALSVADNGGVYFVPAFSGLYAPYWKDNARGVIAGLTRYATKAHLARAVLEATAFQTREVLEAMEKDSGIALDSLRTRRRHGRKQSPDAISGRHPE